jgi:predicted O-methyltransferase YrrM
MSSTHSLTLLNVAARCLGEDEWYLEVGSYRGRSLVGASLDHTHGRFAAIESFREFVDQHPDVSHEVVRKTLATWGVEARVQFIRGDAFRLLPRGAVPGPVGVYFYDGAHTRLAQWLALAVAEPLLADEALVVIDDTSWPQVDKATRHYVRRHPGYELIYDLEADQDGNSRWRDGVKVYAWRRPADWQPPSGWPLAWRRFAHLRVHEPMLAFAWRTVPRFPRLAAVLKRVYFNGSRVSPSGDRSAQ